MTKSIFPAMVSCLVRQLSCDMPSENYPRKLLRAATYDSGAHSTLRRKRLLSDQNDYQNGVTQCIDDEQYTNKRAKTESRDHDSGNNNSNSENQYQMRFFSSLACFENTKHCPYSPSDQHRRNFGYINSASTKPLITPSPHSSTTNENMLLCQQTSVIDNNPRDEHGDKNNSSPLLTAAQLSAYMTTVMNNANGKLLIIDCGTPLRHNERRIRDSFLLNINDKLSRKRLTTRGLKNFLDPRQLQRLDQSETIVLYDDSMSSSPSCCANATCPPKLPSTIKCIFDELKRHDSNKTIYVLQSTFDEFYQHYPTCCYLSASNAEPTDQPSPSPSIDLESCEMSEILPGLYLGNARDAENRMLLKQNAIQAIINISTSIPCYYAEDSFFDYLRLTCQDSSRENILQYFESTFKYMHGKISANQNLLVHCQGGISRSPSFIIGYLMKYHGKTFDQAYQLVKEKRKIINPNLSFLAQLTRYEQLITATTLQ